MRRGNDPAATDPALRGRLAAFLLVAAMLALAGAASRTGGWPLAALLPGEHKSLPAGAAWRPRLPALLAFRPLSINRATAAELAAAPGIGPVLAARIIAARRQRGGFSSPDELAAVEGIGRTKLAALCRLFTVP